jgi:hypothetical protein
MPIVSVTFERIVPFLCLGITWMVNFDAFDVVDIIVPNNNDDIFDNDIYQKFIDRKLMIVDSFSKGRNLWLVVSSLAS